MYRSNFDLTPFVEIDCPDGEALKGYEAITQKLAFAAAALGREKVVVCVECSMGMWDEEVLPALISGLHPVRVIRADDCSFDGEKITAMIRRELTDDRVFGVMSHRRMEEFFDQEKTEQARRSIEQVKSGLVLVYGTGATLIHPGDQLVYSEISRREIQLRMRDHHMPNWKMDNCGEDMLRKFKRGYFVEWRLCDRLKKELFHRVDFFLDTNKPNEPHMLPGKVFREGLRKTASRPFRVVPYFDPGVWGGQWMKEKFHLDPSAENYSWSFDCVPEENSLLLKAGDVLFETPSVNVVFFHPQQLLGTHVHGRFGAEFPIRFDFLDTMEGGNLSLQVHPTTEYIQDQFGMNYTQDESYYILDAGEDACVYLGLKEGVQPEEMLAALRNAQAGGEPFDAEKYVNRLPAKKGDHFLIPGGTVHCSGRNCVVLEISATTYIFTFKLWDWGRVGLDGIPRPVHIDHGAHVIRWDRTTSFVKSELVNRFETVRSGENDLEEHTGLHPYEFLETRRNTFSGTVLHTTNDSVNVLNLVDGREAIVESPSGKFEPFVVHFAESFIVPAGVGEYTIRPYGESEGKTITTMKAYVR